MASIPNHSIVPITESDIPPIAQNLYTSKIALTINRLLWKDWPNETAQLANCSNAITSSFQDPTTEMFLKVVDIETDAVVGHLVLTRRNKKSPDASTAEVEEPAETPEDGSRAEEASSAQNPMDPEVLAAVIKAVTEINEEMTGIEHLEITHIYVKSSHRKRGIGSQLVQMSLDKAKEVGLPLRVASEPAAHDFFLGRGFRDTKHVDFDLEKWAEKYSGFGLFRLAGMAVDI